LNFTCFESSKDKGFWEPQKGKFSTQGKNPSMKNKSYQQKGIIQGTYGCQSSMKVTYLAFILNEHPRRRATRYQSGKIFLESSQAKGN
jgi:hypothetical protein